MSEERSVEPLLVLGVILFGEPPADLRPAIMHVRLLDTTLIDAPARTLAAVDIDGARAERTADGGVRFRLPPAPAGPGRREVWVHVDMDRSGDITPGDYLTTQSFPTPAASGAVEMTVRVARI